MAVSDCTRTCRHCGAEFRREGKGQPTKYCSADCKRATRRQYPSSRNRAGCHLRRYRVATCLCCGKGFRTKHKAAFCSARCRDDQRAKAKPIVVAVRHYACAHCGGRWHGTRPRKHCGRTCEKAALALSVRTVHEPRPCKCCKAVFTPSFRRGPAEVYCSDRCLARAMRRQQRIGAGMRRARMRGATADRIDKRRVFERDKWRCHLCGCKTLKRWRHDHPRAPELDHIIALADGGAHTWGNVACSCRACNGAKSARSMGQLGLAFAA